MNFATAATDNPEARRLEKEIHGWLEARGHVVRGSPVDGRWEDRWVSPPDFVIVLGGDGFILEQSTRWSSLIPTGAPMVRVNFGRRGFLANVEPDDVYNKLGLLVEKKYIVQHRERISAYTRIGDGPRPDVVQEIGNGLNDIVLERTNPRTILFKVECGVAKHEYMSDGVIFSTRTGSSGYNRSAGGPITEKNGSIIVNPICPIDQAQWWMRSPDAPEITVTPSIGRARLVVDGREKMKIAPGQEVYINLRGYSRFVEFGDE